MNIPFTIRVAHNIRPFGRADGHKVRPYSNTDLLI